MFGRSAFSSTPAFLRFFVTSCLFLATLANAADPENAGRAVYVGNELLKEFQPKSQLVTKQTPIDKPKFPVIDIHCHWYEPVPAELLIKSMDELGIEKAINLSGGWGDALERNLARYRNHAPDRLLVFANVDFEKIDESNFGQSRADALPTLKERGVSGLKVFKSLGLTTKDSAGKVIAIDDARLDPIFAKCAELKLPVLIHSADPPAFFESIDRFNERWMQLRRHPDWSFFGVQFPKREEVLAQRNNLIGRHQGTVFIVAHLGEHGDDLAAAGKFLDANPNVYVDLSGREAELGRQPYAARKFLMQYAERVVFGSDRYPGRPDQPRHRIYYRMLETDDEYFDYFDHPFPPTGDWKIYGLFLPDEVLEKIYNKNARRALAGEMPLK